MESAIEEGINQTVENEIEARSVERFHQDPQVVELEAAVTQAALVLQQAREKLCDRQLEIVAGVKKEMGIEESHISKLEWSMGENLIGVR